MYLERLPYREQQPDRQRGFGTGDFTKRDEFTLVLRCEQHRQQLRVGGWRARR